MFWTLKISKVFSNLICRKITPSFQDLDLKKNDELGIKLYTIELLKYQESVSELSQLLSSSELDRANRYHFIKDKKRFIICRGLLKFLLARYIGIKVDDIILEVDLNKKPFLPSHPSVFFNVSHAGNYALIAISKCPVGVDVEYVNKIFDYHEILPQIFNETEIANIKCSLEANLTFYQFWTRKEAIVKALGKGIDDDISKFQVTDGLHSLDSELLCGFKSVTVCSFNLNDDYVGSLAITEDDKTVENIVFCSAPNIKELKSLFN